MATIPPITVLSLLLLQLVLWLPATPTASAQATKQPLPVARPGCRDRCGNATIPYPFGIGPGCYRDGFQLECDDSRSPPRLTSGGRQQLIDISLRTSEARAYLNATRACYNTTGGIVDRNTGTYMALYGTPHLFSATRNKLVALGCPNLGYFVDGAGYYVSGCTSVCRPSNYVLPGPCTGVGCCQSAIPSGLGFYEPYLLKFAPGKGDAIFASGSTACSYVFLVDAGWFDFTDRAYLNRTDDFSVPVVLDWAIRDVGNCSAAKRNLTTYACRSAQSECLDVTNNSSGYRCNCSRGYEGNPYLDAGCRDIDECLHKEEYPCYGTCTNTPGSYVCSCPPGSSGDASTKNGCRPKDKFTLALKAVTGVSIGVFLSVFMCFWCYLGLQKRKLIRTKHKFFEQNGGLFLQQQMSSFMSAGAGTGAGFKIFSKEELEKATDDFNSGRVIGRGGHGIVYKGVLEDKTVVAVKKSKMTEQTQAKEFANEMVILSQINHKNVVKLLGCCLEVEVPMLVYEFVSNGTLYHYIHDKKNLKAAIPSNTRLRIAAESAEALAYMHSSASPPILHGDVKTANILLDDKFTARVSDFGTSKLAPADEADIATLVQGTCGYLDPEYMMTCQLTDKSDVYSFGVVLLEILTRKKALYFDGPEEDRSLVSCFMTAAKAGRHVEFFEGEVNDEMRIEVLEELAHLVIQCLSMSGEERPAMKQVAETLERLRRFQQQPWGQGENPEEMQSLLVKEQRNVLHYDLTQPDVFDLEEGSTYTISL